MTRWRRQNFTSWPQALSSGSENTHWNLSATMLSCPRSIGDSFRCIHSNTHTWSFRWIIIEICNKIKHLKVPTYEAVLLAYHAWLTIVDVWLNHALRPVCKNVL